MALAAARAYGVNPNVFLRQINHESGFNPNARSSAGAVGIAQFEPKTAAGMGINPLDPRQALYGAAKLDAENLAKYHSYPLALAAYNAGGAAVDKYRGIPPFTETQNYVKAILGNGMLPAAWSGHEGSGANIGGKAGQGQKGLPPVGGSTANQIAAMLMQQATNTVMNGPGSDGSSLMAMAMARQAGGLPQVQLPNIVGRTDIPAASLRGFKAGGFLPLNAPYKPGRIDQGHDFQTAPGAPIIAPGAGIVERVASDPNGFGPAYPIVKFTSGPYAGRSIYIGHTISQLDPGQRFNAGAVLSRTGTKPIGNAQVPGWAEIGYAPGGVPGPFGQPSPFSD